MLQILESDIELIVESGFLYLPLPLDPSIENEVRSSRFQGGLSLRGRTANIREIQGRYYQKSINIRSLVENYSTFDPLTYEYLRKAVLNKFLRTLNPADLSIDEKLRSIVFQVLPHFIRKKDRLHRKTSLEEEVLDLIGRKVAIPSRYFAEARGFADTVQLQRKLRNLAGIKAPDAPAFSGLVPAKVLRQWFLNVLETRIIEEEKIRLGTLLRNREQFSRLQEKYIAILLFIRERGALELSGCGFFKSDQSSEYYVYVHTGEYALKDIYGRVYLFPDCQVAVSTIGPLVPYVLDRYKHPFLKADNKLQKICVRGDFVPGWKFSASGAVQALEEGLNALFYGYNSRRGNGYHRLDGMKIEENSVVFDDLMVPRDHPKLVSGEVEIKNDFYG